MGREAVKTADDEYRARSHRAEATVLMRSSSRSCIGLDSELMKGRKPLQPFSVAIGPARLRSALGMNVTASLLGLAGVGDVPWLYFLLVPTFLVENHHSTVMTCVQGGGLAALLYITARFLFGQKTEWRARRLLILFAYPGFVSRQMVSAWFTISGDEAAQPDHFSGRQMARLFASVAQWRAAAEFLRSSSTAT